MSKNSLETSVSLLEALARNEADAWQRYFIKYHRLLHNWATRWGLSDADAEDLIQETLLVISAKIPTFQRRGLGSFRSWMRTIAWFCWRETLKKAKTAKKQELYETLEKSFLARQSLESDIDLLVLEELLHASMERVRGIVEPRTWEAFQLTAIKNRSAKEAAEELNCDLNTIYSARCRVQQLIDREYKKLSEDGP